jgi:hypothetical protein
MSELTVRGILQDASEVLFGSEDIARAEEANADSRGSRGTSAEKLKPRFLGS